MTMDTDHGAEVQSWTAMVYKRFRRHKLATAGVVILFVLYLTALLAPHLATHDFAAVDPINRFQPPSVEHFFGTDRLGRDVFSRVLWGARVSLSVGFVAAGVAVTMGTVIGAVSGYFGGWVDNVLQRFTEIVQSFPTMFLLLTIIAIVDRSIFNIMLVIGITSWPGLARLVRGEVLALRKQEFVEAARGLGARNFRIIFRHILPNAVAPIIVNTTLGIAGAILAESSLSFLGLGVQEPFPSWGSILNSGRGHLRNAPWVSLYPGIFIFITVLAFNYIGDGLRDALDPRLKQ
ncbi:MAG: ABC transporter permease [Bacillota bacterium]